MKLSIITINYNNATGLRKTMESVLAQTTKDIEYIVVDGGSADNSRQIIRQQLAVNSQQSAVSSEISGDEAVVNGISVKWVSEPDNGIYHAMNKGIKLAQGDFVQFLNSGDVIVAPDVTERMLFELKQQEVNSKQQVNILYGNMLKPLSKGIHRDKGPEGKIPTMFDFYGSTLNHSPAYIKRSLFEQYGYYDEQLRIVSDWKWYLEVIGLHNIVPVYEDIDVTIFDMTGISSTNGQLEKEERRKVLEEVLPLSVLRDYDQYADSIDQMNRINSYRLMKKLVWLLDRILFKFEKHFSGN